MPFALAIEPNASAADIEAVRAGLLNFNRPFISFEGTGPLNIFLRDQHAALAGGLLANVFWGWLHVDILWIAEAARGQGYGSRMLALAEQRPSSSVAAITLSSTR